MGLELGGFRQAPEQSATMCDLLAREPHRRKEVRLSNTWITLGDDALNQPVFEGGRPVQIPSAVACGLVCAIC
jgi:hypothetical protein